MKKRILSILLSLMFALPLFTGCKSSRKIVVSIGIWPEAHLTEDNQQWNIWKSEFETLYPEYTIKPQPYSYSTMTFTALANSGSLPTVFSTWFTEPQKLIANRYVKDITTHLEELGWLDKMDDFMREALTANGKVYGVPRDGYALGLMLNLKVLADVEVVRDVDGDGVVDIYDENGDPMYPTTFEEVYEVAKIVTEQSDNIRGMHILSSGNTGGWQFSNIAWNFGADLQVQEGGKWVSKLNSQESQNALAWIKKMKDEKLLPDGTNFNDADWFNKFGAGSIAMCFTGSDKIIMPVTNVDMDINDIAFVPMPAGPEGDQHALFGGVPYMFAWNASDKQVEGALKFLEHIGKSPNLTDEVIKSVEAGYELAIRRGLPILPSIKAWKDPEYLSVMEEYEAKYINVNLDYYKDFFESVDSMKRNEEPHYCQEMYGLLDTAIQKVFADAKNANVSSLLSTANLAFQTQYLNSVK